MPAAGLALALALPLCWANKAVWAADTHSGPGRSLATWYRQHLTHPAWHDPNHALQILARTGFLGANKRVALLGALRETRPSNDIGVAQLSELYRELELAPGGRRVAVLKEIEAVLATGKRPDEPGATFAACDQGVVRAFASGVSGIGAPRQPTSPEWWIAHQPHGSALVGAHGDLLHLTPVSLIHEALAGWLAHRTGEASRLSGILASPRFKECLIPVWWLLGQDAPDPNPAEPEPNRFHEQATVRLAGSG